MDVCAAGARRPQRARQARPGDRVEGVEVDQAAIAVGHRQGTAVRAPDTPSRVYCQGQRERDEHGPGSHGRATWSKFDQ